MGVHKSLCCRQHVDAFPTLRWYEHARQIYPDYLYERTVQDLLDFVRNKLTVPLPIPDLNGEAPVEGFDESPEVRFPEEEMYADDMFDLDFKHVIEVDDMFDLDMFDPDMIDMFHPDFGKAIPGEENKANPPPPSTTMIGPDNAAVVWVDDDAERDLRKGLLGLSHSLGRWYSDDFYGSYGREYVTIDYYYYSRDVENDNYISLVATK